MSTISYIGFETPPVKDAFTAVEVTPDDQTTPVVSEEERLDDDPQVSAGDDAPGNVVTDDPQNGEDVSLYYVLGEQLRKDGEIEGDDPLPKNATNFDIYERYRTSVRSKVEEEERNRIKEQLAQEYDEVDLLYSKAMRSGVDPRLFSEAGVYEKYSNLPDDANIDAKVEAIKAMHTVKKFSQKDSQLVLDKASDLDIDEMYSDSKTFFGEKLKDFQRDMYVRQQEYDKAARLQEEKANKLVKSVISNKKVYGESLTVEQAKEIEKAIYSADQIVNIEGVNHKATEFAKFMYDFQNDPELRIYLFTKLKYRAIEKELNISEAKKQLDNELWNRFEDKKVVKDVKNTPVKMAERQQKSNQDSITTRSFMIG